MHEPGVVVIDADEDLGKLFIQAFSEVDMQGFYASDLAAGSYLVERGGVGAVLFDSRGHEEHLKRLVYSLSKSSSSSGPMIFVMTDIPYAPEAAELAKGQLIKLLTRPITVRDIVRAVRMHVLRRPHRIDYRSGINDALHQAVSEILGAYLGGSFDIEPATVRDPKENLEFVSAFSAFSGTQILGSLALSFQRSFIVPLAAAMLRESQPQLLDSDTLADLTAELCNQISGRARNLMIEHGLDVEISIPKRFLNAGSPLFHPGENQIGYIRFQRRREGFFERFRAHPAGHVEFCFDAVS